MVHITLTNESCGMDETILYPPSPCGEVSIVIEVTIYSFEMIIVNSLLTCLFIFDSLFYSNCKLLL